MRYPQILNPKCMSIIILYIGCYCKAVRVEFVFRYPAGKVYIPKI